MTMRPIQIIAATLAVVGTPVSAFWRMECRGVSAQARIDPLVDFGKPASHAHEIFGSSGFSETAEYTDLVNGDCTSCAVTEDKSAYWTPYPFFKDNSTGEYEAVANVGGMLAYYFLNAAPTGNKTIQAFPPGFRMIAGDTNRRNYTVGDSSYEEPDPDKSEWAALGQTTQDDLAQRALGFNCLDYSKNAEGSLYRHFMPSKDYIDAYCPDGIRFELMFPSCWNGVDLDSENHRDHVAYPNLVIDGNCPDDFPVRLPGLFYETIWDMGAYTDRDGIFVISNGDPLGFGYHGDFIMGWEETDTFSLQAAVNTCTNLSGEIEDCPLFTVVSEATQNECKIDLSDDLKDDDCEGPLSELPGGVEVAWGPAPAGAATSTGDAVVSATTLATLSYSAGSTASVNGSFEPGNVFKASATTVTAADITAAPTATNGAYDALITMATSTFTYTDADGDVTVSEIVYEEAIDWVTETTTTTEYVQPTGVARRNAHVHNHMERHLHARRHQH